MKRALCAVFVAAVLSSLSLSGGLPEGGQEVTMSDFKVILPIERRNLIGHPQVFLADITGFVDVGGLGSGAARSTAQSRWGLYSLAITPSGANPNSGRYYSAVSVINTAHAFSVWVHGTLGVAYTASMIDGAATTLGTTNFVGTGGWQRVVVLGSTGGANNVVQCHVTKDVAGGAVFYADGWQLEVGAFETTFVDGTRRGCEWLQTPHAGISQRSGQSRAGGRVRDLEDDYNLNISGVMGPGTPPQSVHVDEFAITPGGQYASTKIHPRVWLITGFIDGTSCTDLHAKRQALITLFDIKAHPESQPVTLRYTGAPVEKEIQVYYEGGLEGVLRADQEACHREKIAFRVVSPDPFWHGVGEDSVELDIADDMIFRTVAVRSKATGQWDNMGPPNVVGGYHTILAIARDAGGRVYLGGHFDNWDNQVSAQNVVMWDPATGTYTPLGVGLDGVVRSIAIHPNGQVYIAGGFTDVRGGPTGTYNYIVRWDPIGLSYNALGVGTDDDIYTLVFGQDGTLFCGGEFHNAGGAGAMHVAQWTVAGAWLPVDVGLNAEVFASDVGLDGGIYFAGNFNDLVGGPGQTYSRLAKWNPVTSTWTTLTSGRIINGHVNAIEVYKDGNVYFGGDFPTVDAQTFNDIGMWNGTALVPLMLGLDDEVHALETDPTGLLHVGGRFTAAVGDIELPQLAQWNGSRWLHADIRLPVIEAVWSILVGAIDPVLDANYDLFVGGSTPVGGETIAGRVIAVNVGTAPARPRIAFHREGGGKGSAGGRARIRGVRNETTGKIILYAYGLLTGETLTADTTPANQSVRSSWPAAQGRAKSAVLHRCDFGTFELIPGTNVVSSFVTVSHAEFNDQGNQLSDWENIWGVTPAVTDAADNLYISVIDDGGGFWHVEIFDDVARGGGDLVGHTPSYNGVGVQPVIQDGGSGLGGVLTIDALGPADVDIYVNFTRPTAWMVWTPRYRAFD